MQKITIKISGMHCSSCSMVIDGDLEYLDGVISSKTNFAKGISEIEYDQTKVSVEDLNKVIQKAGYAILI